MTNPQPSEDRVKEPGPAQAQTTERPRKKNNQKLPVRRILLIGFAFIAGFVVLGFLTIQVWEWSNSVEFCANMCHDVHPEEIPAYQDSFHARVKCTECHMGRVGTVENIVLKASHFRHLPEVLLDRYERPTESESLRPPNESCELCHWPPAFHGDTVREFPEFLSDRDNTALRTYLILKTGAGDPTEMEGFGIHWHVAFPVEYYAIDEHAQEIQWVRATLPNGRTVEYTDVTNPVSEIDESEIQTMNCVDCHNRVGHPFDSPSELTDNALASGALNPDLPFAKREMADLLSAAHQSQEGALAAVGTVRERYQAEHPEIAQSMQQEIEQAEQLAQQLLTRLVFEEPGITWRDFPDESGHEDFPGCFRCHDGKHMSADGEPIRLHCNICHSIPVTVGAADRAPDMPVTTIPEPASHLEANFMADHRFQADESCITCHGDIEFGTDSSSFCANYACHGRAWPEVELDAAFPHPIPLEAGHAGVWCHDCHEGVRQPEFVCANCHTPPPNHFGPTCEDCHTVAGWDQATVGEDFVHPIPLEGAHAEAACNDCHAGDQDIDFTCANCHEPPPDHFGPSCEDCHEPTSFAEGRLPAELHPIPLIGAHAETSCDNCHVEEGVTPEYVCENCHERPENHLEGACDTCHSPEGWAESAERFVRIAPEIPHQVEGRQDCYMCHDPAGDIQPAPETHADAGYTNEQCGLCHKVAE